MSFKVSKNFKISNLIDVTIHLNSSLPLATKPAAFSSLRQMSTVYTAQYCTM